MDETQQPDPSTAKVRIRRVAAVEPVTGLTVVASSRPDHWQPDPAKDEFEVDAITAAAAVATGGFEVLPESRVQLKASTETKPAESTAHEQ